MSKGYSFNIGDALVTKLAALRGMLAPKVTDASITEELAKQNYYAGYQDGVKDTLEVVLALIREEKK